MLFGSWLATGIRPRIKPAYTLISQSAEAILPSSKKLLVGKLSFSGALLGSGLVRLRFKL